VATILVADDDPHIREVVSFALESAGHTVVAREDGKSALEGFVQKSPDLVVLDVMMPGLDGIEVCRRIRQSSTVPILFLSARDDEIDKVIGLEVGGDDYLTKPFGKRELVARVKAMLRRIDAVKAAPTTSQAKSHGALRLDAERFTVTWKGEAIVLTVTEFGLLEALLSAPGKVYTRSELVDRAYRFDNHVTERTIDTHVKRVRKKFGSGSQPIETVFGLGYRIGSCEPED
jgi:two-component system, OmpR family, response regulator